MASKKKHQKANRAKSLVMVPLYRPRREKPERGKGSYRREKKPKGDEQ